MKTGQRVVCIANNGRQLISGPSRNDYPVKGLIYTINSIDVYMGKTYVELVETPGLYANAASFIPLDENWTEEVIANVLKKQLTEPVNNGLHFSQIIG